MKYGISLFRLHVTWCAQLFSLAEMNMGSSSDVISRNILIGKRFISPKTFKSSVFGDRVHQFRLTFFSVLSERVFAQMFPVLNKNEHERRTIGCAGFAWFFFSPKQNGYRSHFPHLERTGALYSTRISQQSHNLLKRTYPSKLWQHLISLFKSSRLLFGDY
jgi:hypothetical protein